MLDKSPIAQSMLNLMVILKVTKSTGVIMSVFMFLMNLNLYE